MRFPSVWLRLAGIAAVGATAIACTTSAAAGGTAAAPQPSRSAVKTILSGAGATGSASGAGGNEPAAVVAGAPQVTRLTPRQMAGQRVIYSYAGLNPPAGLLSLIRSGQAAGVIFFGNNISSKAQIAGVIRELDAANAAPSNPVRAPLLLMTDQEGGLVRRLPGAPTLSEKQIGESAHPVTAASTAGKNAAANLRSVGMNVNLAPVLDVYRTAGDFDDQFQRSYSKNPQTVSQLGAAFIKAQQQGGVAATAKHFPGLGSATRQQNTDEGPVTLHASAATLRGTDEFPYPAAIAAKTKLIMVSWAVYPGLGATRPGGLSVNVVQGELRNRLGYTGVTVTDALEAGALKAYGSIQNRALLTAKAGMDLLLCSGEINGEGVNCMNGLLNGYNDGKLPKAAFQAATSRVLSLRASLPH